MTDPNWERHAEWWQREFTEGADPEYVEQILPLAEEWLGGFDRVLDIGTGEGQLARRVRAAHGATVVGIDGAHNQVVEARQRGGQVLYGQASALDLPFAAGAFDAAVACLVFEHVDDLDGALAEVARVLRPGGRFILFMNHPLLQTPGSGWIDDQILDPPEQYWRIGPYLSEGAVVEEVTPGTFIRFVHRPLGRYLNRLQEVGLGFEQLVEPAPPPGFVARAPEYAEAASIPRLAVLVSRRCRTGWCRTRSVGWERERVHRDHGVVGAGRSQAGDILEDLGWFVIDNVPTALITKVSELASSPGSSIPLVVLVVGPGRTTRC